LDHFHKTVIGIASLALTRNALKPRVLGQTERNLVLATEFFKFSHDAVGNAGCAFGKQAVHHGSNHVQLFSAITTRGRALLVSGSFAHSFVRSFVRSSNVAVSTNAPNGKIDEVGIDQDMVWRAQLSVVLEKERTIGLFHMPRLRLFLLFLLFLLRLLHIGANAIILVAHHLLRHGEFTSCLGFSHF